MSAATETSIYSPLERRLLDDYQHSFPMTARPYADIARECGVSEAEVVAAFERLIAKGAISRIGAVLRPRALGASTLAAMTVPPERLEEVAAAVSAHPGVNHNYEREHELNLWFVMTAPDEAALEAALADIEARTGLAVHRLPMLEDYHVDLEFRLEWT